MPERDTTTERVEAILLDEARTAYLGVPPVVRCHGCGCQIATADGYSAQADGVRVYYCEACNLLEEPPADRSDWPIHQPGPAYEAPIPGTHWYGGCEPGYPRVDPDTGICEGCGAVACTTCGRENCPDHPKEETC